MSLVALRRLLIQAHLYFAALLAPFFLMVGVTGALYVADIKGEETTTPITFDASARLDPESATLEDDVRGLLAAAGVPVRFDYLVVRGASITTRPTSRAYARIDVRDGLVEGTINQPDTARALMELHKGHGPEIFRSYQIVAGSVLALVVLGGVAVGLLAPSYRRATILAGLAGLAVFALLAFVA